MRAERGILFPNVERSNATEVLEKTYSFDDVVTVSHHVPDERNFQSKSNKKRRMVSHKDALRLDAIIQDFIFIYF